MALEGSIPYGRCDGGKGMLCRSPGGPRRVLNRLQPSVSTGPSGSQPDGMSKTEHHADGHSHIRVTVISISQKENKRELSDKKFFQKFFQGVAAGTRERTLRMVS